ncbi:MAG: HNH endonuclease [Clostridiales bacterium]|nr:HNH endonuclease [Clostridiales bacterium]
MAKLKILPKRIDILDASSRNCFFRINIDVINECFGANRDVYRNACYPQGKHRYIPGTKPGEKYVAWMPKMYGNSSGWKNSISPDDSIIYEVADNNLHYDWIDSEKHDLDFMRLVFVKPDPVLPYMFKGVFVIDKTDFLDHTYRRIATRVRLIGNPVTRIELLDNISNPTSENKLESLCNRFDPSISIDECLKKKSEEFARYVNDRDRRSGQIDFNNPKSILSNELYKHKLFERSKTTLNTDSWDESWIGTGKIFEKIFPVIVDNDNNLINNFNNKTDFNDHFRKNKTKYDPRSEQAVYNIFKSTDERKAFEYATDVFGRKYPTLGYLFFLKDEDRFLPLSPESFEKSFRELNIDIRLNGNCSWQNYCSFINIINCIRELLPSYIDLDHEPTLLEAHSFVWIIGRPEFTSWLKGQEYKKSKELEKQLLNQKQEELEQIKARNVYLSLFSNEELLNLGPNTIGHEINNRLRGPATVISFSNSLPLSMEISYDADDTGSSAKQIHIELTEKAKENYYFTEDVLNTIMNHSDEDLTHSIDSNDTAEQIIIPENEDEQAEQAVTLPVEQLRIIAESREETNPTRREVTTQQYKRDPYIAELAKQNANGICQLCGMDAPFITAQGKPYLETHHIKWLSEGGSDTIENTVAVCPNCHRKLHVLNDPEDVEFLMSLKQI